VDSRIIVTATALAVYNDRKSDGIVPCRRLALRVANASN